MTALAARSLFKSGFAFRLMATNPWVVLGVSLVGSIGTMMGTMYTSPENTVLKHTFWLVRPCYSVDVQLPDTDHVCVGLQCLPSCYP